MKKRSKILISLAMFVLCAGMLVFGVWSASQATFNLTSNISFNPSGVFLAVSGKVRQCLFAFFSKNCFFDCSIGPPSAMH